MVMGDKESSPAQLTDRNCSNFKAGHYKGSLSETTVSPQTPKIHQNVTGKGYGEARSPPEAKESFCTYYVKKHVIQATTSPLPQPL